MYTIYDLKTALTNNGLYYRLSDDSTAIFVPCVCYEHCKIAYGINLKEFNYSYVYMLMDCDLTYNRRIPEVEQLCNQINRHNIALRAYLTENNRLRFMIGSFLPNNTNTAHDIVIQTLILGGEIVDGYYEDFAKLRWS